MIVTGAEARASHLKTLSDAAAAHPWRLGVGYEFAGRPDGLDGLLSTYGIHMAATPQTMDLGLLYTALEGKQVDMIAASATDGQISKMDVAVLAGRPTLLSAVSMRRSGARSHGGAPPRLARRARGTIGQDLR